MTKRENELIKLAKINRLLTYYKLTNKEWILLTQMKEKTVKFLKNQNKIKSNKK